jgi:hypothetical protein
MSDATPDEKQLNEARRIASDYATALNDCERSHDALLEALKALVKASSRAKAGSPLEVFRELNRAEVAAMQAIAAAEGGTA